MSYRIEGDDIVISGFENGIADSPYQGISDMRNVDIISIPGEASVAFATTATTIDQASITNQTFTASSNAGLLFTWAGGTSLPNGTAITVSNSGGALPTGLIANKAYYVKDSTSTTFHVSAQYNGSAVAFTDAGSGTNRFTAITMAKPKYKATAFGLPPSGSTAPVYIYMLQDGNGRVWVYYNQTEWVYANNLAGNEDAAGSVETGNGIALWKNYCFSFRQQQISSAPITYSGGSLDMSAFSAASNWHYAQQIQDGSGNHNITAKWPTTAYSQGAAIHEAIVGQTDDVLYFSNVNGIGTLLQVAGKTFDPADTTTYVLNPQAVALPSYEISQCIGQIGTSIISGSITNVAYIWDRVSIGYTPIFISEIGVYKIVSTDTNAYLFTGQRGRIFVTNGAQAELFKKIPDHISGQPNPYFTYGGAVASRSQIYFGVQATNNAGTAINQYGGVWALDLETKAIRLVNQMSYGSYSGIVSVLMVLQGPTTSDGFGLLMGWYNNSAGGVDKGSSTPYTGGQAYIDSDLIPVGTYYKPYTPIQVEWKVSAPLGSPLTGTESVALYYRLNLTANYTLIGTTSGANITIGDTNGGTISDAYQPNFQKGQWLQLRAVLTSTNSSPSYCRLTEIRLRQTQ
jgi:hypothetical protein